jgi:hypothetical protein
MKLFIDPSSKKIYKPLIEKLVNGYNSKDILQGKNINDRVIFRCDYKALDDLHGHLVNACRTYGDPAIVAAGILANPAEEYNAQANVGMMRSAVCQLEPPAQAVLFASLASAIQSVYLAKTERVAGQITLFTEENFANVSEYQKELMRAYLPVFEKQLEMLIKRSELIKQVIEQTSCKVYKWNQHYMGQAPAGAGAAGAALAEDDPHLFGLDGVLGTTNGHKRVHFQRLDENDPTYTQPLKVPIVEPESMRKSYLISMSVDIVSTAKSLLSCINTVQKELSDVPLFFETYKDSIVDFNNRNQTLPVMPLSILTHLMNMNLHRADKTSLTTLFTDDKLANTVADEGGRIADETQSTYRLHLLPNNAGIGSTQFKFAYGTRGLLSHRQKPIADYAPGAAAVLEYEKLGGISGGAKLDKPSVNLLVENTVLLSRYILDYSYHTQYLDSQRYDLVRKLVIDNQRVIDNRVKNLSCQSAKFGNNHNLDAFWSNSQNIAMLAENDNVRQSVYRLVACLRGGQTNLLYEQDRDKMLIFNILDLNVVPINFHSLQREIPFVNLMNYAGTFDHLTKHTLGVALKNTPLTSIHGLPPAGPDPNGEINAAGPGVVDVNTGATAHYLPLNMEQVYSDGEFIHTINPEDQLVRHLIYPLGFRRIREYMNDVYHIMAGNTSLSLSRPKFLSDQLWNKVLLNTLYNGALFGDPRLLESRRSAAIKSDVPDRQVFVQINYVNPGGGNTEVKDDSQEPLIHGLTAPDLKTFGAHLPLIPSLSYFNSRDGVENKDRIETTIAPGDGRNAILHRLGIEGYLRYNTRLVRWIEWSVQAQRMVRILMRQQLEWIQDPVVREHNAIAEETTEYGVDNRGYRLQEFE